MPNRSIFAQLQDKTHALSWIEMSVKHVVANAVKDGCDPDFAEWVAADLIRYLATHYEFGPLYFQKWAADFALRNQEDVIPAPDVITSWREWRSESKQEGVGA